MVDFLPIEILIKQVEFIQDTSSTRLTHYLIIPGQMHGADFLVRNSLEGDGIFGGRRDNITI